MSQRSAALRQMVQDADRMLRTASIQDWDAAVNGLQVENQGRVTRIAAAVDGSLATIEMAIAAKADLLIVHHGLFWSKRVPWTGVNYQILRRLLDNNLAIYSAHLPLDMHPRLGNNVLLARALGFRRCQPFFWQKGQAIGLKTATKLSRTELRGRLERALSGPVKLLPGGAERCRVIGIVTGGAGAELKDAVAEGVDTFITGEGPHWTFPLAEELGVNVFYGGHYATETFGVKALAAYLGKKFRVPWEFLDHPSGL